MAAAVATLAGAPTRLHRLLHHQPPPSFLKPLLISSTAIHNTSPKHRQTRPRLTSPSLPLISSRLFCFSPTLLDQQGIQLGNGEKFQTEDDSLSIEDNAQMGLEDENDEESEKVDNLGTKENAQMGSDPLKRNRVDPVDLPELSVKEKKELGSYAHSLGKKLKSQLVGKSGVTASVAASFVENLESNELLKVKIHGTCPGELDETVKQLADATNSVVVGQIGRTVILYRPSLTKLKAEEKKEQMRKIFLRRNQRYSKPMSTQFQSRGGRPKMSERDSRGRIKVSTEFQKRGRPNRPVRDSRGRTRV